MIIADDPLYEDVGRDYERFDKNEASITTDEANYVRTAGVISTLVSTFSPNLTMYETMCMMHDVSLQFPLFILSTMEVAELAGESVGNFSYLMQSVENTLLAEDRFQEFLTGLNLKSKLVEKIYVEFLLVSKRAYRALKNHLQKKENTDQTFCAVIKNYKSHINAIFFLVVTYCGKQNTEKVREKLSRVWEVFTDQLVTSFKEIHKEVVENPILPSNFIKNLFLWDFLEDPEISSLNKLQNLNTDSATDSDGAQAKYQEISARLVKSIEDVRSCRDFYLTNSNVRLQDFDVQECPINVFDTLKQIEADCSEGLEILQKFDNQKIKIFKDQVKLQDILLRLKNEITEANYFSKMTVLYFTLDRTDRFVHMLNVAESTRKAFFKGEKREPFF